MLLTSDCWDILQDEAGRLGHLDVVHDVPQGTCTRISCTFTLSGRTCWHKIGIELLILDIEHHGCFDCLAE